MAYPGNDPTEDPRTRDHAADRSTEDSGQAAGGDAKRPGGPPIATRRAPEEDATQPLADRDGLYFFPEESIGESRVRWILQQGSSEERAWVISHLLRYAQWDDIWQYVSRDEVREVFAELDLPEGLRAAWSRMLKVEAPVA
jgi:hypothetical protein